MRHRWLVLRPRGRWAAWPAAAPGAPTGGWTIRPTPDVPGAPAQRAARPSRARSPCVLHRCWLRGGADAGRRGRSSCVGTGNAGRRSRARAPRRRAGRDPARRRLHRQAVLHRRRRLRDGAWGLRPPWPSRWDGRTWTVEPVPDVPGTFLDTPERRLVPHGARVHRGRAAGGRQPTRGRSPCAGRAARGRSSPPPSAAATTFSTLADVACARRGRLRRRGTGLREHRWRDGGAAERLAERWDGRTWRLERHGGPRRPAAAEPDRRVVREPWRLCRGRASTEATLNTFATLAEHQDGASWTLRPAPSPPGGTLGARLLSGAWDVHRRRRRQRPARRRLGRRGLDAGAHPARPARRDGGRLSSDVDCRASGAPAWRSGPPGIAPDVGPNRVGDDARCVTCVTLR